MEEENRFINIRLSCVDPAPHQLDWWKVDYPPSALLDPTLCALSFMVLKGAHLAEKRTDLELQVLELIRQINAVDAEQAALYAEFEHVKNGRAEFVRISRDLEAWPRVGVHVLRSSTKK